MATATPQNNPYLIHISFTLLASRRGTVSMSGTDAVRYLQNMPFVNELAQKFELDRMELVSGPNDDQIVYKYRMRSKEDKKLLLKNSPKRIGRNGISRIVFQNDNPMCSINKEYSILIRSKSLRDTSIQELEKIGIHKELRKVTVELGEASYEWDKIKKALEVFGPLEPVKAGVLSFQFENPNSTALALRVLNHPKFKLKVRKFGVESQFVDFTPEKESTIIAERRARTKVAEIFGIDEEGELPTDQNEDEEGYSSYWQSEDDEKTVDEKIKREWVKGIGKKIYHSHFEPLLRLESQHREGARRSQAEFINILSSQGNWILVDLAKKLEERSFKWVKAKALGLVSLDRSWTKVLIEQVLDSGEVRLVHIAKIPEEYRGNDMRGKQLKLIPARDIAMQRMREALSSMHAKMLQYPTNALMSLWSGDGVDPDIYKLRPPPAEPATLNNKQRAVIENGLFGSSPIQVVQGPFGTGKTQVLKKFVEKGLRERICGKILATAPSNYATNKLLHELMDYGPVRVGARPTDEKLDPFHLDYLVGKEFEREGVAEGEREELEDQFKLRILRNAKLVVTTCTGAGQRLMKKMQFTHLVIDEVGQCAEPEAVIPLQLLVVETGKVLLAGDHLQLPPTIMNQQAKEGGLGQSVLERLFRRGDVPFLRLDNQYRCHPAIAFWPSLTFYVDGGELENGCSAEERTLGFNGLLPAKLQRPMCVIDVPNGKCLVNPKTMSRSNQMEAEMVKDVVQLFREASNNAAQVLVLTPYRDQVNTLKSVLNNTNRAVSVGTVDGSQGSEADVVIVSTVRSEGLGFLEDRNRLNVLVTRAKSSLLEMLVF